MGCFNIYIFNRQGVCIFSHAWFRPKSVKAGAGSQEGDHKQMFGLIWTLGGPLGRDSSSARSLHLATRSGQCRIPLPARCRQLLRNARPERVSMRARCQRVCSIHAQLCCMRTSNPRSSAPCACVSPPAAPASRSLAHRARSGKAASSVASRPTTTSATSWRCHPASRWGQHARL